MTLLIMGFSIFVLFLVSLIGAPILISLIYGIPMCEDFYGRILGIVSVVLFFIFPVAWPGIKKAVISKRVQALCLNLFTISSFSIPSVIGFFCLYNANKPIYWYHWLVFSVLSACILPLMAHCYIPVPRKDQERTL